MLEEFEDLTPLEMADTLAEFRQRIESDRDLHPSEYLDKDVKILYTLAHKYYSCDQYKEAETFFMRLVLARPAEKLYWQGLATSRQMQKDYAGALTSWGMCASLDDDISFLIHGAECLLYLDQRDEARDALEYAKSIITENHPSFPLYTKLNLALNGDV